MRVRNLFLLAVVLGVAGQAQAAVKFYDSSFNNGLPGDAFLNSTTLCPPMVTTLGGTQGDTGVTVLEDDGLGSVTLVTRTTGGITLADLTAGELVPLFGPGAFIFIDTKNSRTIAGPHVSNSSGIGAHGPSSTAPGGTTEWGVVSGWSITGRTFCVSSPTTVCTNAGFSHGVTIPFSEIESPTYDLGTWNFDAEGDYESKFGYIVRTSNGGLTNNGSRPRGALHGAALPALPLVGLGALAVGLAVIGSRAMRASK
jgi:hypothetical protein